jgi:hypothetical protein
MRRHGYHLNQMGHSLNQITLARRDSYAMRREQAVSLAELFYDLVYVYAIARMTSLFHGAQVAPDVMGAYILTPFAGLAGGTPHSSPDRFWRAWPASPGCSPATRA